MVQASEWCKLLGASPRCDDRVVYLTDSDIARLGSCATRILRDSDLARLGYCAIGILRDWDIAGSVRSDIIIP